MLFLEDHGRNSRDENYGSGRRKKVHSDGYYG
jgi:hypothetical protein